MQAIAGLEVRIMPISLDPREHTKYHRQLNRPLSPGTVQELAGGIRELVFDA